ncbi:hypothetical protein GCM10020370_03370 [Paenibacillus hodogayensis]
MFEAARQFFSECNGLQSFVQLIYNLTGSSRETENQRILTDITMISIIVSRLASKPHFETSDNDIYLPSQI